ncbi:MAG: hypothetical protein AB7F59_04985 [Bdellovibrionales bacterium]
MKRKSSSGQVLIEAILMMVLFLAAGAFIAKKIREGEMLSQLAVGPWSQLVGMIENGTWGGQKKTKEQHPNYLRRHISLKGQLP